MLTPETRASIESARRVLLLDWSPTTYRALFGRALAIAELDAVLGDAADPPVPHLPRPARPGPVRSDLVQVLSAAVEPVIQEWIDRNATTPETLDAWSGARLTALAVADLVEQAMESTCDDQ